jgi:predicted GH43/DUF377 family glycosyl hydrolase
MNIIKNSIRLHADSKGVITHFLYLPGSDRIANVVKRVGDLTEADVDRCIDKLRHEFVARHRDIETTFLTHFKRVEDEYGDNLDHFSYPKKLLLGAFFTKEYSIQAAALFNPSIVPHPDQHGLKPGEQRFLMSLRATGEGHISSIVFQTGIVDDKVNVTLDSASGYFTCLQKNPTTQYTKDFIAKLVAATPGFDERILDMLPDLFSAAEAVHILKSIEAKEPSNKSIAIIEGILDSNYDLELSLDLPINEKVIFPNAKAERMGMEDVRLVKFTDEGRSCYYGTYTAYDGKHIKTQLLETTDFNEFKIRTLYGPAVHDKGMALFPEKINGKYAMVSRQGGEKISIMFSDDLYRWDEFKTLMEPVYPWELVQLGNCGSPLKTDKGWLLLTHGVGIMRTYVISAILLDLHDPSRIIGRLDKPLVEADANEREGYVPNVVYTCGFMRHGNVLIIPYAVSDSATGFATIELDEILNAMKSQT